MKTVLYNFLCLYNVRQGYLTVLRNLYAETCENRPNYKIIILIQEYPFRKYFAHLPALEYVTFKVVNDIRGKVRRGIYEQLLVPYWAIKLNVDGIYMPATFGLIYNPRPVMLFFHVSMSFTLPKRYLGRPQWQAFLHNCLIKITTRNASHIHCTTYQTKKELMNYVNLSDKKVSVNYNGISRLDISDKKLGSEATLSYGKFLLSVSAFYRHKKQDSVLLAFKELKMRGYEGKLILVGAVHERDYYNELLEIASEVKDDVVFLHNISNDLLNYLYSSCEAYVFLSIFEGFGLTPFEALSHGKQVVISTNPTLREIYLDSVHYVDPYNIREVADKIEDVLFNREMFDSNLLESLYKRFSWKNFVNKLNSDISEMINDL